MDDKILLSISEVAARTGLSRTRLYEEISAGRLIIRKCGRRTLVPVTELKAWVDRLEPEQPCATIAASRTRPSK